MYSIHCTLYSVHRGAEAGGILGVSTPHFWRDLKWELEREYSKNFEGSRKI